LITIETKMKATADHLRETAKGKSREFNDWKKDMRAKVYGGCAAGIIFPPAASTVSKKWYMKVTDFKNVIQNQYDLI